MFGDEPFGAVEEEEEEDDDDDDDNNDEDCKEELTTTEIGEDKREVVLGFRNCAREEKASANMVQ